MHVEPIDDELEEDTPPYRPDPDPLSVGVGGKGYVHRYVMDECVERFEGRIARFPETFDRFYFAADGGAVLVDILQDGTPEQLQEERLRKRVAFKTEWCAENDRRYLAIGEMEIEPSKIRALLADGMSEPAVSKPARSKPAAKRGAIQRPKAAA